MTNQKTPEQGGATEEQEAAAARALFEFDGYSASWDSWDKRDRLVYLYRAQAALAAAFAHPADERHDAEERDIAGEIEAERLDTDPDALGADAYINGLLRAEEIARSGR